MVAVSSFLNQQVTSEHSHLGLRPSNTTQLIKELQCTAGWSKHKILTFSARRETNKKINRTPIKNKTLKFQFSPIKQPCTIRFLHPQNKEFHYLIIFTPKYKFIQISNIEEPTFKSVNQRKKRAKKHQTLDKLKICSLILCYTSFSSF